MEDLSEDLPSSRMPTHVQGWQGATAVAGHLVLVGAAFLLDLVMLVEAVAGMLAAAVATPGRCTSRCRYIVGTGPEGATICGAQCCRASSHRSDLPHCCERHGTPRSGQTPLERLAGHLSVRLSALGQAGRLAAFRAVQVAAGWPTLMLALLLALVATAARPGLPSPYAAVDPFPPESGSFTARGGVELEPMSVAMELPESGAFTAREALPE